MLQFIQNLAVRAIPYITPLVKPAARWLAGLFTRNATPNARAYADLIADDFVDTASSLISPLSSAYTAYHHGDHAQNIRNLAGYAFGHQSQIKHIYNYKNVFSNHYRNYQFLNSDQERHEVSTPRYKHR